MKETAKKRVLDNKQVQQRPVKAEPRDHKPQARKVGGGKNSKSRGIEVKESSLNKHESEKIVGDLITSEEFSEAYDNMAVDYVDDVNQSEEASEDSKSEQMIENGSKVKLNSDVESENRDGIAEESDAETVNESVCSQADSQTSDEKVEKPPKLTRKVAEEKSKDSTSRTVNIKSERKTRNPQMRQKKTAIKAVKVNKGPSRSASESSLDNSRDMKVHPKPLSDSSEGVDEKELKEVDVEDTKSNVTHSVCSDDETINCDENGENEDKAVLKKKIEEMEMRLERLEQELKEVAALEIALYSVVPEHGSSAHKVHTPARRLSRLYLHACKYWSQEKRATVARNTVSGLVLVSKSCGNDVSRLTFWLSNVIVLRQIIFEAFGSSCNSSSLTKILEVKSSSQKRNSGRRQSSKLDFLQFVDNWQETRTFTAALEKVESWIFSRVVESIWWQTLTPNMQSPTDTSTTSKSVGKVLGPALGDQQQGNFSINLWKNAFQDAFIRLCPVRAGGHECGCLPVLARKVMEQSLGRLDVAMFNAILRESAHEIPTDPVSDPIVDSKVLPIPAGDLSFGSGAQLKNSVGNWAKWLTDQLGVGSKRSAKDDTNSTEEDDDRGLDDEPKCFPLLNELSDLLMLPKDMLMDRAIRTEVCPSITLPLVKRVLCNFTPDEFCPDAVPGAVLEALNAECIIDRRLSGNSVTSFPYPASPVMYMPPSSSDVASVAGGNAQLSRNASAIQRKGYTSDEELDDLESCLTSILDFPCPPTTGNGHEKDKVGYDGANARYELLREVWRAT